MPKDEDYKFKPIEVRPGERVAVSVADANGRFTNCVIEVRSTAQPNESPNAFSIEVFEHTPERCIDGCEPILSMLCVPPEEQKAYAEIRAQDKAERHENACTDPLAVALAEVFGPGVVHYVDETGIHPIKPKG